MEDRVQLRLDEKLDHGLRDTITNRGHSQLARASRCLGNFYLLDRRREVRPRRHPIPQLVEILRQIPLEIGDGFIVDAGSTAVGPDLLVGVPYRAFRYVIRFRRAHATHPRRLATLVGRITPPLRSTSITETSSLLREAPPLVPASVFFLMVLAICHFPSHLEQGSHVPYQSLYEDHAAYTPAAIGSVSR